MSDDLEIIDKLTAREQEKIARAWAELIAHEAGRLVLWSILEKCEMQNFGFHDNGVDAIVKGRQQVGAELLADFVYPNGMQFYADMLLEAETRQNNLEVAIAAEIAKEEQNDEY